MPEETEGAAIEAGHYRAVLGGYPTGVVVVTAETPDGPVGLAIGSFSSVSLDPPLVGFLPDKASSSWPRIEAAGAFCVNVLADDQLDLCRRFATRGVDRYAGLTWRAGATGAPVLEGVLAWIDCTVETAVEVGDHWFVIGLVHDLGIARDNAGPLLFFRGGYGRFDPA
jgi:flavin reductase (DIM6/NTAB) family NADH-FMN oxidoreductase RutF